MNDLDLYLFDNGKMARAWQHLGAHPDPDGGVRFATWAPGADYVSVVGEWNGWDRGADRLEPVGAGIWAAHVEGAKPGDHYKLHIGRGGHGHDKTDPYAFHMEPPSEHGHKAWGLSAIVEDESDFEWTDDAWLQERQGPGSLDGPMSVYEVHLGSWKKNEEGYSMGYREIAEPLADHVEELGFTHVEFMPLMEHPYYGSWGYQVVGYFAPTHRFGTPDDLRYLIDYLHSRGIGVIFDWVPAHFATDPQGLSGFDHTPLYEHPDPQMARHPDWGTYVFDYGRGGVKSFLVSNALYWLEEFHVDGLRFDAVASMLYRDYSRGDQWTPNQYGGNENLEAIDLLKSVNETVYQHVPNALMIAEESTAWPGVSAPTYDGGLGFLYKWNMGWMHDTLAYFEEDPINRKYHHSGLTFPFVYAYAEHYALPLSHDEVVHGKGSLFGKMPGDAWQKAANLRLLYAHMVGSPGKKLLFMGQEWGQPTEWNHDHPLPWDQREDERHAGIEAFVRDAFTLYKDHPALWNDQPGGFEWVDWADEENSVISYLRRGKGGETLLVVVNATPVVRERYGVGVPEEGTWKVLLNSDAEEYGGSGAGSQGEVEASASPQHGRPARVSLTLPPLGALVLEAPRA